MLVNENLINREDTKKIGNFALTVIDSEYIDLLNKGALSVPYSPTCCKNHMLYGL